MVRTEISQTEMTCKSLHFFFGLTRRVYFLSVYFIKCLHGLEMVQQVVKIIDIYYLTALSDITIPRFSYNFIKHHLKRYQNSFTYICKTACIH